MDLQDWTSRMFDNIGRKLKAVAVVLAWIGIFGSIVSGALMLLGCFVQAVQAENFFITLFVLIVGCLVVVVTTVIGCIYAWLSVLTMYGLGELIEQTTDNAKTATCILEELKFSTAKRTVSQNNNRDSQNTVPETKNAPMTENQEKRPAVHSWRCNNCGRMTTQSPCEHCGQ